jgi:hypothetical protein
MAIISNRGIFSGNRKTLPTKTGTIAAGALKADLTATAFAEFGVNLTSYQTGDYILKIINNTTLYEARGYISATAPGGLTVSTDLLSGWNLTDPWTKNSSVTIVDADSFSSTAAGSVWKAGLVSGRLYKRTFERNTTATSAVFRTLSSGTTALNPNDAGLSTGNNYYIADATYDSVCVRNGGAGTTDITSMKCEYISDCAATGALILSTKGGATRAWTYIHPSFNGNLASTYQILKV